MEYRNPTGSVLEAHIVNQLDRILDRQADTQRAVIDTQKTVERIEVRCSMASGPKPKKAKEWNIQLMIYLAICALAIGGHISVEQAKVMLTALQP